MRIAIIIVTVGLALWACGETEPPEPPYVASVTVEPDSVLVDYQETATLTAVVRDQRGEIMQVAVRWDSGDEDIATVDQNGVVTGRGPGPTTITASVDDVRGVAKAVGTPPYPASVTVGPEALMLDYLEEGDFTAAVRSQYGGTMTDVEVSWSSDDASVVTVDAMGRATGRGVGTARVVGTVAAPGGDVTGEAVVTGVLRERGALMHIYESMNGAEWNENDNWGTDAPLDEWYGVQTGFDGNVFRLQMQNNNLSGTIPPEVEVLTQLEVLDFHDNDIEGEIPPEIGNLTDLWGLALGENHLTGTIPPGIGQLAGLLTLQLMENELGGPIPPQLGNLANLSSLDLSGNELAGPIPGEFGMLTSIVVLEIQDNPGLTGALPRELLNLRPADFNPVQFYWYGTDLCSPPDEEFRMWLASIISHRGQGECES